MRTFLRIEQIEDGMEKIPQLLFSGELVAAKEMLVTDFSLVDLAHAREFGRVRGYARCTESNLTLLLRLLTSSKQIPELAPVAAGRLLVLVQEGPEPRQATRELLQVDVHEGRLDVCLICPEKLVCPVLANAGTSASIQDAIRAALIMAFGWERGIPSAPRPLSSIPIRDGAGGWKYVLLRDVPPLPRRALIRGLSLRSRAEQVSASDWLSFIQRLAHEYGLP